MMQSRINSPARAGAVEIAGIFCQVLRLRTVLNRELGGRRWPPAVIEGSKRWSPGSLRSFSQTWIRWIVRPLQSFQTLGGKLLSVLARDFAQREPVGPGEHRFQIEIVGQGVIGGQLERQEARPREGQPKRRPTPCQLLP